MKKHAWSLLLVAPLAFLAPSANAEDIHYGVGAELTQTSSGATVFVPVRMGALRVEPEFGITRSNSVGGIFMNDSRTRNLGVGLYYAMLPVPETQFYVGARVGKTWTHTTGGIIGRGSSAYSYSSTYLMPTVGAEHFFTPHLSLGLTASYVLYYQANGTELGAGGLPTATTSNQYSGASETHAVLRYYFQ